MTRPPRFPPSSDSSHIYHGLFCSGLGSACTRCESVDILFQYSVEQCGRESDLAANIRGWFSCRFWYDDLLDSLFAKSQRTERYLRLGNLLSEGCTQYGGGGAGILYCISSSDMAPLGFPDATCIWYAVHGDAYGVELYTITGTFLLSLSITV